jgi:uncharacterized damage-inducible protein DinB
MLADNLGILFERDIMKIKNELMAYRDQTKLWSTTAQINNSGGNLCLHLLGNLQYYIGEVLGHSGYIRDRPKEFSQKNIPVAEMLVSIDQMSMTVTKTIKSLSAETLAKDYPEKVFGHPMSTEYFLLHLLAHLGYHLGQINYHRRILDAYQPEAGG